MDDNIRGFPGYHITKEGKLYRYGKLEKYVTSTFLMYAKKLYEGQLTNV